MFIETDRLILRELDLDDATDLSRILSDPETMQYYPRPYTFEETMGWIKRSRQSYRENGFGLWAQVLKSESLFIGQCGILLTNIDGDRIPEIGYHIHKKYWNRGLATEAAGQCLEYGFENSNLDEIFVHAYVKNIPSQRIAEKIGMKNRWEYDKTVDPSGRIMRHVVFSMKKNDFKR